MNLMSFVRISSDLVGCSSGQKWEFSEVLEIRVLAHLLELELEFVVVIFLGFWVFCFCIAYLGFGPFGLQEQK